MPYLLEEAYEAYAALEDGDLVDLREELGDVLLQVVFHARLAEEATGEGAAPWSIDDVAGDLVDKLVRRHPHVFAGTSADDLEGTWEALKKAEKGRTSVTDGVPLSQPALALAAKLQKRAGRLGAPVPTFDGLGGELWELVRRCRDAGLDPEVALRTTARAYRDRLAGRRGPAARRRPRPGRRRRRRVGQRCSASRPPALTARRRRTRRACHSPPSWSCSARSSGCRCSARGSSPARPARASTTRRRCSRWRRSRSARAACVGLHRDGPVLDVHHADHPDSRNVRLRNGLSLLPRASADALRARYGEHLVDGAAGESLLLETAGPWTRGRPGRDAAARDRGRRCARADRPRRRRRRAWSSAASASGCRSDRSGRTSGRPWSTSTAAPAASTPATAGTGRVEAGARLTARLTPARAGRVRPVPNEPRLPGQRTRRG